MRFRDFTGWTAERVEVAIEKVVLDLLQDGTPAGRFTVYQDGRLEPTPPSPEAGRLLRAQAGALRGQLTEVACPHCNGALCKTADLAFGMRGVAGVGPRLDHDSTGYFKTCPHCGRRVAFEVEEMPHGMGARLRVAGKQS